MRVRLSLRRPALALIVVLGLTLRFYGLWFGLPHPFARPDEEAAVLRALAMHGGDLDPRFFHWPSLTIYVFAALFAVASAVQRAVSLEPLHLSGALLLARALVAICGTATIVVLFRLARRVADADSALIAALLLAVALLHVRDSHFAMTDVVMTLLLMATLGLLARAIDEAVARSSPRRLLTTMALAGLSGGLATSTKYSAAAIFPTVVVVHAAWTRHAGTMRPTLAGWAPTIVFLLGGAVGFLIATPYALLNHATFLTDLRFVFSHHAVGHGVDVGRGWWVHPRYALWSGAGGLTCIAAMIGVVPLARRRPWHAALVIVAALALYVSIGGGRTVFFRYALPLVPLVCLFAAVGISAVGAWLGQRTGLSSRLLTGALAVSTAAPSLVQSVRLDALLGTVDSRVVAAAWLAPRLRAEHSLHDTGSTYARLDLSHARFHEWGFDPARRAFAPADGPSDPAGPGVDILAPDWLVLHESPLRVYATTPPTLRDLAARRYALVFTVRGVAETHASAVWDHQDAFFLPMSDFGAVQRPGPTVRIYRRLNQ